MSNSGQSLGTQGVTEEDIANYLAHTPGFFERHADLLGSIQLTSPHGQRAVSLQERQMEMLRDRIKGLEHKIIEMIRHGQDNVSISDRLHRWTRAIMVTPEPASVPGVLVSELMSQFMIPHAGIRVWGAAEAFAAETCTQGVSDDAKSFTSSLTMPYCGVNSGFEAASWLDDAHSVRSLALIPLRNPLGNPLRNGFEPQAFGLLVLGSPDPTRYTADMGTEFLVRIGELASAGLSRMLPAA